MFAKLPRQARLLRRDRSAVGQVLGQRYSSLRNPKNDAGRLGALFKAALTTLNVQNEAHRKRAIIFMFGASRNRIKAAYLPVYRLVNRSDCGCSSVKTVSGRWTKQAYETTNLRRSLINKDDNWTYHALLNVNLHGAFYTLREATRHMRDRANDGDAGGSLVICGSLSIFHGLQGMEHYAGAKGALAAMVKGLAVEMGQYKVRANMLAPGFIMTEMTGDPEKREAIIKHFRGSRRLAGI